jgi:hypothetical protein
VIRVPEYLYHYTTAEGLIGIVKNREIWATDIFYLNDQREFRHGIKLAVEELQGKGIYEGYRKHVPATTSMLGSVAPLTFPVRVYVSCFSTEADSLGLWRSYCPRGGYAIGFRYDDLDALRSRNVHLQPCFYDETEQRGVIRGLLTQACADYDRQNAPSSDDALVLVHNLAAASIMLKDPSFT